MKIRHTQKEDIPEILSLFEHARNYMRLHNNPNQWNNGYPSLEIIEEDIQLDRSYVLENDQKELIATMMYQIGIDETYLEIDGAWLNDKEYGVIHRIASKTNQKGAASFLIDWALEQCPNLRIDTHEDNVPMLKLLSKHKFSQCGNIYLKNKEPRLAFHKERGNHQ